MLNIEIHLYKLNASNSLSDVFNARPPPLRDKLSSRSYTLNDLENLLIIDRPSMDTYGRLSKFLNNHHHVIDGSLKIDSIFLHKNSNVYIKSNSVESKCFALNLLTSANFKISKKYSYHAVKKS